MRLRVFAAFDFAISIGSPLDPRVVRCDGTQWAEPTRFDGWESPFDDLPEDVLGLELNPPLATIILVVVVEAVLCDIAA